MPARYGSARPSSSATSTRAVITSTTARRSGRRSRAVTTSSPSTATRSRRAPTSGASTSRDPNSRSGSATSPAANATGNLLLLDEPTNDLDVETLRALEEALLAFPGCVVVISHDRWFLDRIATHILAFEGDSQVTWFEGNYADYEADRHRRLGTDADQPHRIKYKRLVA